MVVIVLFRFGVQVELLVFGLGAGAVCRFAVAVGRLVQADAVRHELDFRQRGCDRRRSAVGCRGRFGRGLGRCRTGLQRL